MSATLTSALEQLDKAIAAVDVAFNGRMARLEKQNAELDRQMRAEREKNATANQELTATITQLETYLQRTGT